MILGLDVSSSIIGLSIIENKKLIHIDYFDLKADDKLSDNQVYAKIKQWLINVKNNYKIDKIRIEEPIKKCSNGKTSINVLAVIFKVNFTVCWMCYDVFGFDIEYLGSSTARKKLKINIKNELTKDFKYYASTKDIKKRVLERIIEIFPEFEKKLTYSKNGFIESHLLDIADAVVMAYYEP